MADYYDPATYPQAWNYLEPGTIIDHYIIERELAHGGFSSVYLARQLADQMQVAIKEYLPRALAHRTWNNAVVPHDERNAMLFKRGRALFFKEAKILVDLKHPNIVEVLNFFQANSTVYMVMSYDYGIGLNKLLNLPSFNINETFIVTVFQQLLHGVAAIHAQQLLHLDIKPANILIRPDCNPLLLDFGASQPFVVPDRQALTRVCSRGFSPIEQYTNLSAIGPWSDVYAIGASIRACLDGKIPPDAPERLKRDTLEPTVKVHKRRYPPELLKLIDWSMQLQPQDRPQSIAELQHLLAY